jgi:lysophospholipase L1-like esterase
MKNLLLAGFALVLGHAAFADPVPMANYSKPIKVACVGDSITAGYGVDPAWSWDGQLARLLGDKWELHNFGVSGATMLQKSDRPYMPLKPYADALALQPDVVIIELGTNDTKPQNWNQDAFVSDYQTMIRAFQTLPNKPLIYLCLPVPVAPPGNFLIPPTGPDELMPLIRQLAAQNHCGLIDFNTPMASHLDWLPDHVHPNPDGGFLMAKAAYSVLTGTDYTGGMLLTTQGPHPHPPPKPAAANPPATNAAPVNAAPATTTTQ